MLPRNVNSKPQANNTEIASKKRKSSSDLHMEGVSDIDLLNQVPPEKALPQEEATKGAFVLARTTANSSTWNEAQIYEVLENDLTGQKNIKKHREHTAIV